MFNWGISPPTFILSTHRSCRSSINLRKYNNMSFCCHAIHAISRIHGDDIAVCNSRFSGGVSAVLYRPLDGYRVWESKEYSLWRSKRKSERHLVSLRCRVSRNKTVIFGRKAMRISFREGHEHSLSISVQAY